MSKTTRFAPALGGVLLAALAALAALGAAAGPSSQSPRPAVQTGCAPDLERAIRAANEDWLPAMRRGDAAAIAAPYAEDGLFVSPEGTVVKGRDAIRQLYADRLAKTARKINGTLTSDGRACISDGLAYEWGHASLVRTDSGGRQAASSGTYLTVWRREASGRWVITRNLVF